VKQAAISTSAARKAIAASVKPVAFITHETVRPKAAANAPPQPRVKPAGQRKMIRRGHRSAQRKILLAAKRTKTGNKVQNTQAPAKAALQEPTTLASRKKPSPSIAKQQ
jgi:hypothetical protein